MVGSLCGFVGRNGSSPGGHLRKSFSRDERRSGCLATRNAAELDSAKSRFGMNLSGDIELPKGLRTAGVLEAHLTLLRPLSGDDNRFSLKRGAGMAMAGGFALPDNNG